MVFRAKTDGVVTSFSKNRFFDANFAIASILNLIFEKRIGRLSGSMKSSHQIDSFYDVALV